MKTIKLILATLMMIGIASSGFAFSAKYTTPNWDAYQGTVSYSGKANSTSVGYTPRAIVNYDKQHISWFESSLKPQNTRKA